MAVSRRRDALRRKKIAHERVDLLLAHASEAHGAHPERARRYVALSRTVAMRVRLQLTVAHKRQFCKACNAYLVPGMNSRVRIRHSVITRTCLDCGAVYRMPFTREQRERGINND